MFDWLSRDEAVVSLYQSDEKCNFVFTATGFRDLFTLITKANNPVTFRKTPKDLPLLFISGDKDPVGRYGEGVRRTVNLYRGNGVKNIEVIFYKDARHEVLNELDRLETFALAGDTPCRKSYKAGYRAGAGNGSGIKIKPLSKRLREVFCAF